MSIVLKAAIISITMLIGGPMRRTALLAIAVVVVCLVSIAMTDGYFRGA